MRSVALLLFVCACPPAAPAPRPVPAPEPQAKAPPPECVEKAQHALGEIERLREIGDLDAAFRAHSQHWETCPEARRPLTRSRFDVLLDLDYRALARELATEARDDADEGVRKVAATVLASPQAKVDELAHAERMTAEGRERVAAGEAALAQKAFDRAMHAYRRAGGDEAQPIALVGVGELASIADETVLVPVRALPTDEGHALLVDLTPTPGGLRARPRRLIGRGERAPRLATGPGTAFALSFDEQTEIYASRTSAKVVLPAARRVDVGFDGLVVLTSLDQVILRDVADPSKTLRERSLVTSDTRIDRMSVTGGGRIVTLCEDIDGSESVFAVDTKRKDFAVYVDNALRCRIDHDNGQLVVLRTEPTPTHAKLLLELHPLDDKPVVQVAFPEAKSFEGALLWTADGVATVTAGKGGAEKTFFVRLSDGKRVPSPPRKVDKDPLRGIPIGSADSSTDVSVLASLSKPPRAVVPPYFARPQVWFNNGVRSFDEKTVAVFDDGPEGESDVHLLLADTHPLKLRHRIPLSTGLNWLTAFFASDRVLVVQSYPSLTFVDVVHGEIIDYGSVDDGLSVRMVQPERMAMGSRLWDLSAAAPKGDRAVDLGVGDVWFRKVDGGFQQDGGDAGSLTLRRDGAVELGYPEAPSWLHCRFGELIAPWDVCRTHVARK